MKSNLPSLTSLRGDDMPTERNLRSVPASPEPEAGFNPAEFLPILYRHWKLIAVCGTTGILLALGLYLAQKPMYASEARLLVRYVLERSTVDSEQASQAQDTYSEKILNDEVQILTSWDLAREVAKSVNAHVEPPLSAEESAKAAKNILKALEVDASARESNVLRLTYQHENPETAVKVLQDLVNVYFERHLEIHRSAGAFEFVSKQTEKVRDRLQVIDTELNQVKEDAEMLSVEGGMTTFDSQRAKVRDDLLAVEAQLAEHTARVKSLEAASGIATGPIENAVDPVDPQIVSDFQVIYDRLTYLRTRKFELMNKFGPSSRLLADNQDEIDKLNKQQRDMLAKNPTLASMIQSSGTQVTTAPTSAVNLSAERAQLAALLAKTEKLRTTYNDFETRAARMPALVSKLRTLERRRQEAEETFNYFSSSLDKAQIDEALDPSKIPNISIVQAPSPPTKAPNEILKKIMLLIAGGGFAGSIGWAFLYEFYLNRRINRSADIERRLKIPVLLSIPLLKALDAPAPAAKTEPGHELAKSTPGQGLARDGRFRRYAEAIRDRLFYYFSANNVVHSPKLIGVASFEEGSGTTTLAESLATSFSEQCGESVLLVDMNASAGEPNSLEDVQELLYLCNGTKPEEGHVHRTTLARLYEMLPQFRSSNFAYVIFDMPAINSTSPTTAMAGFMDKLLLVLDGENMDRDRLQRTYDELIRMNADVSCIFNKEFSDLPRWLERVA